MFPWLWFWNPKVDFPLSGDVVQDFSLDQFFSAIKRRAGNGELEREIFDTASYGKQIGWISEVLLSLAERVPFEDEKTKESFNRLKEICKEIEEIKGKNSAKRADEAIDLLNEIKEYDPQQFEKVIRHFGLQQGNGKIAT